MAKENTKVIEPIEITVEVEGKETDYTLDFDLDGVKRLETMGYEPDKLYGGKITTMGEILLIGAFWKNHPNFNGRKYAMEIYTGLPEDERVEFLVAVEGLRAQALDRALFKEKSGKNVTWRRKE